MDRKKILFVPASAGLLALALFGGTVAYADSQPPQSTSAIGAPDSKAETAAETATESATEKVEAGDPALPGGGHSDANGQNVDNQFDGVQ